MIITIFVNVETTERQRKRRRSFEVFNCPVLMPLSKGWACCGDCDVYVEAATSEGDTSVNGGGGGWGVVSVTRLHTMFPSVAVIAGCSVEETNEVEFPGVLAAIRTQYPPSLWILQPTHFSTVVGGWFTLAVLAAKGSIAEQVLTASVSLCPPLLTDVPQLAPWESQAGEVVGNEPQRQRMEVHDVLTIGGDCCAAQSLRLSALRNGPSMPLDWVRSTPKGVARMLSALIMQHATSTSDVVHDKTPSDDAIDRAADSPFASHCTVPVQHTRHTNHYQVYPDEQVSDKQGTEAYAFWWDQHYQLIGSTEERDNARRRWPRLQELFGQSSPDNHNNRLLLIHVAQSVGLSNGLYCQVNRLPLGSATAMEAWQDLMEVVDLCVQFTGRRVVLYIVNLFTESFAMASTTAHVVHAHVGCEPQWERTAANVAEALSKQFVLAQ